MTLSLDLAVAGDLSVATLAGLAVGIEREWSGHATGPAARFAGARTFLLLGFVGGIAGWLAAGGLVVLGAVLLAGASALVAAAYVMAAQRGPSPDAVEGTTEVAALAVLALGTAAGLGFPLLTSAAVSVLLLALVEKTRIHGLIARIGERELAAALQFAVLALVILPLLPTGPYGPFGAIRPRALWIVVLLLSGVNFMGYVARRAIGERRGYGLTGVLGGIISSTAITLSFSSLSRRRSTASGSGPLAAGVFGACTVLLVRTLTLAGILNPSLIAPLVPYVVPPFIVGAAFVLITVWHHDPAGSESPAATAGDDGSPLGLGSALRMALAFQGVLILIPLVQASFGDVGVLTSAAIVGITDIDALTLAMAKLAASPDSVRLAAQGIGIGLLASTLLRLGIAVTVGAGAFRRKVSVGLAAFAAAVGLGIWIATRAI